MLITVNQNNLDLVIENYSYIMRSGANYTFGVPKDILPYDLSEFKIHLLAKIKSLTDGHDRYIILFIYLSYFIDDDDFCFLEDVLYQFASLRSLGDTLTAMPLNDLKRIDKMLDKQGYLESHLLNELDEAKISINSQAKDCLYNQKQCRATVKSIIEAKEKMLKK